MPHPKEGYRTQEGKRVPGVTTITGRFKESGGLIDWANRIAREPLLEARHLLKLWQDGAQCNGSVNAFLALSEDTFDYRLARDKAADAGTIAHEMFDCHVRKVEFDPTKHDAKLVEIAKPAFSAGAEWATQSRFEVTETEVALVSEAHKFGGTRDGILVSGKRAVGDVKTSKGVYPEMLLQIAAYGILDEEYGNTIDGGYHLLNFSKQEKPDDPVRFTHYWWSHLDKAREGFLLCRQLYGLMSEITKLAK